jgi:putative heme-binding domain-containing protein
MTRDDNDDHNIPKFIWFAFEPLVTSDPDRAIKLAKKSKISLLSEYTARRLVDADELGVLASGIQSHSKGRASMMKGMRDGMEGLSDIEPPKNWDDVYATLKGDKRVSEVATEIAQQFGDIEATMQLIATLNNKKESIEEKRAAIRTLANKQHPILIDLIPELIEEQGLRKEAIRSIAAYHSTWDKGNLGGLMMKKYNEFDASEKLEVVQAMASRNIYARYLSWALQKGTIPKKDIPAYTARQLRRVLGSGFLEVWGPLQKETSENMAAMVEYKKLLTDDNISSADPGKGRYIFEGLCGACHVMYGEGGILGPELTGADRSNIDYLLNNVMDPSGIIQDDYKMVMITTRDGRTYAGNIANENDRSITLRVVGQDAVVISKSSIQSMDNSELSMMPEAMLDDMSPSQVLNLFAYLMSKKQVKPITH